MRNSHKRIDANRSTTGEANLAARYGGEGARIETIVALYDAVMTLRWRGQVPADFSSKRQAPYDGCGEEHAELISS